MIRRIIISSIAILGLILSIIFERNISGTHFASLSFAGIISIYWFIELLLDYISFRKKYSKEYDIYKVQLLNSSNQLTLENINERDKVYYRRFKRTKLRESCYRIIVLICFLGIILALIIGFFI